jgi:hypothetical protein
MKSVLTSVMAPVQIEGILPSGTKFYFRERGGMCNLAIGDNPVRHPLKVATRILPTAGLLPEDGRRILEEMFEELIQSNLP